MTEIILDQKKAYRKGMVLGFTMAEITIMLLFCILLAMAFVVDQHEEQLTATKAALSESIKEVGELAEVKEAVLLVLSTLKDKDDKDAFFHELRRVRDSADQLRLLQDSLSKNDATSESLLPIRTALTMGRLQGLTEKQVIDTLISDANFGHAIRDALKDTKFKSASSDTIAAMVTMQEDVAPDIRDCQTLKVEKERLKGQLANIQSRLNTLGRGTEMPACWASPETGKPEYIFQVDLTQAGLVIHDQRGTHRVAEQQQLPFSLIQFKQPLSREAFRSQTTPISTWSRNNNCRFFVVVKDLTNSHDKESYKNMLRAVEEHFYKLEVR